MKKPILECETLIDLLEWRAQHTPGRIALIFNGSEYPFQWLWDNCRDFSAKLMEGGVRNTDRVLVLVPNSPEFFLAFYGGMMTGAVIVPLYPDAGIKRCSRIVALSNASHIILPADVPDNRRSEFEDWAEREGLRIHFVEADEHLNEAPPQIPRMSASKVAFIQYTSGSTGFPKGVLLTHRSLLTNIRQMISAMQVSGEDVFVSWLPVYHDMGLILMTMVPVYAGAKLVLLPVGMQRIHSWLKAIEQYRGTFIAAPDTAYRLCVKGTRQPEGYDLSSLRVALNASEPIHLDTCQMFEKAFRLKHVMVSGYGLAEATVAVTMHPPGFPPVIDQAGHVASGLPVEGVEIRIDRNSGKYKGDGRSGEILVRSPALMEGYADIPTDDGPIDPDGYLHTGDVGYLDESGNLFVLSRIKNIIIHAGHTLYPDDVEQVVRSVQGIRAVAAVGIENPVTGGENLSVFIELTVHQCADPEKCHDLIITVVQEVHEAFGIRPARVILLKPKSIPRTPNGKVQYGKLRRMYAQESVEFQKHVLYPLK